MSKYIPWWLVGKWRKNAANALLVDAWLGLNWKRVELIGTALRAGADPNIVVTFIDHTCGSNRKESGRSIVAMDEGYVELAKLLIKYGATIDEKTALSTYLIMKEPYKIKSKQVAMLIAEEAKKIGIYDKIVKEEKRKEEERSHI